jgi:hypothetical protein
MGVEAPGRPPRWPTQTVSGSGSMHLLGITSISEMAPSETTHTVDLLGRISAR